MAEKNFFEVWSKESPETMKGFMDFTGGSRVVAMMSIIILRWLESGGASVKRIVYGDYNSTPKKITDITSSTIAPHTVHVL